MEKRLSKFKKLIKTNTLFNYIVYKMCHKRWRKKYTNDIDYENKINSCLLKYKFDLRNPRTFNEYICWLKHFYHNDLWCQCADKLGCKDFLKEIGLEKYIPKTYGIYASSKEINLDKLPDKFVLKTNHDSGSVFVCDKNTTDFKDVFNKLDKALIRKYTSIDDFHNYEWVYKNIDPKIFAEELLYPNESNDLLDYKFFTFNGDVKFGYVMSNRNKDVRLDVFMADNFNIIKCQHVYLKSKSKLIKPSNYDEMINICKKIGKYFNFVRIDFYNTNKGIKIGELTFFPTSGHGKFTPNEYDFEFGKYFDKSQFDTNK